MTDKSMSFTIQFSLPSVTSTEKVLKRITKVLPTGTLVNFEPTPVVYNEVKDNEKYIKV